MSDGILQTINLTDYRRTTRTPCKTNSYATVLAYHLIHKDISLGFNLAGVPNIVISKHNKTKKRKQFVLQDNKQMLFTS